VLGARNSPNRERDFIRGRLAAHQALQRIHRAPEPILRGGRNEPIWPPGIVGSIAHSMGTAISLVAGDRHAGGIGVDIEDARASITDDMADHILSPGEADLVRGMFPDPNLGRVVLFSAKESVFKAFFTHHRDYFGFRDVEFSRHGDNRIHGRLLFPIPGAYSLHYEFSVRYFLLGGMVLTYLILPPLEA
jgi:enterobactin synthetase component D